MLELAGKIAANLRWVPAYILDRIRAPRRRPAKPEHLVITLADHFEPCFTGIPNEFAPHSEQMRRVQHWCRTYPNLGNWTDADGRPFVHTYFYPAEHYHPEVVAMLAEHCHEGWGELEVHLHHGVNSPDSAQNTRQTLARFRDQLVSHGCLSRLDDDSAPRYAFVHGNWALANSHGGGRFCGVDEEMQILAETGCYADFTLPSAPSPTQVSKVNSLYECALPLNRRSPQRKGRDLRLGVRPKVYPLIMQGPLLLNFRRSGRLLPRIENGEVASWFPPTLSRLDLWRRAAISVHGQEHWCFIKLYCHGMDPRQEAVMLGEPISEFLCQITAAARERDDLFLHFVSAREMVNIALAACDGRSGNPNEFRNYRLRLLRSSQEEAKRNLKLEPA